MDSMFSRSLFPAGPPRGGGAARGRAASWLALLCGGLVAAAPAGRALARTHSLKLDEAIRIAMRSNAKLRQARAGVAEAEARRKSVRGEIGGKLKVEGTLTYWDDELRFELPAGFASMLPPGLDLGVIREQLNTQLSVIFAQPLTPLYQTITGYRMATVGRDAAKLGLGAAAQAIAAETTKAYLGVIQARAGTEIARTAVQQVTAHVTQAQAFQRAGLASRSDVLKAEVALAEAEEGMIKAEAGLALAQAGLGMLIGLPRGDEVRPTEVFTDPPPPLGETLGRDTARALRQRPDLRATAAKVTIAEQSRDIARWNFVPQVIALANYTHATGAELMYPRNSFFVGGMLKWDLWEWGAKYYQLQQAKHAIAREEAELEGLRGQVAIEVKKAFLELRIADKTLVVARKRVKHAEEAYRIEQAKFGENATTTTDVLDAQLALTRAKLSYSNALYGWYAARAALTRSTGEPVAVH